MKGFRRAQIFSTVLLLFGFLCIGFFAKAEPLSDLAEDTFIKGAPSIAPLRRSPFIPTAQINDDIDASSLFFEGVIYGEGVKMALISGRVVREGDQIGRYKVEKISPNEIELSLPLNKHTLKLENYVAASNGGMKKGFLVEFRNASLKDALSLLAHGAGRNIIVPENVEGRVTLSFRELELFEVIRLVLRVNGYEYAQEGEVIRVGLPEAFAGGTDLRTTNFHLKYGTAREWVEKVRSLLSDRGSVVHDDRTNALIVKDRDAIVSKVIDMLEQLDKRDQQVQIEAKIVDANQDFSRSLGIRWGLSGGDSRVTVSGTSDVGENADTTNPLNVNLGAINPTSGVGLVVGRIFGNTNLETQLTAAEEKGDIHILSKPSVTTTNNNPARIRSGTRIYVRSTSSISVGTAGGTAANAGTSGLEEINTGIELTVTPQISLDKYIRMSINAGESEADFSRTVDGIPAVIDNTASTTVMVKDGETTVIGGLSRSRKTKEKSGVPGLQRIPVMGLLFQSRTTTKTDTELMIFITPKIIKS